jgi:hypothetical protein
MDSDPTLFEISAPRGDHLEPPPSSHPTKTLSYELHPALIALVRENSFTGTKEESPYIHLRGFEQVCSIIVIEGMNQQTLKWKLFPFSLVGGVKKWYYSSVGSMEGSWDKLREKFCLTFFPISSSDPTTRNPLFQIIRQGVVRDCLGEIHQFFGFWTRHWDARTYSSTTF